MSVSRRERLKQILSGALECESAARAAFLDQNCLGDDEMRQELEELIAASETADDFLETPLFRVPETVPPEAMAGSRLGQYRLVRRIGRGGMGAVYLAEREDGQFTRQVAIKVVRSGFDSEEMLGRFRRERQILASLAHPHIAMLLDGGATEDGAPYFVMEYIDGQPIDQWILSRALSIQQRLALFRPICSAVEHAHRNLIVHGDIKPANIIVTVDGVPKLLDFGIARLAGPENETQVAVAWTPKFASPEQRRGEPINTVSDVFSLGVLLAEMLNDRRGEAGDLNAIIEKATREDPSERYSTVDALAADVLRYMEGRPVAAHPATPWYRMRKFVRRRRWPVAFATLLLFSVVYKIASDQIQARMLRAERDRANRRFEDVRALANSLVFEIEQDVSVLPGGTAVRAKLVTRALAYLDGLAKESTGDLTLQNDLADTYERLGDVQGRSGSSNLGQTDRAAESYRKAITLRESLTRANPQNGRWRDALAVEYSRLAAVLEDMGNFQAGLEFERKSLAIREAQLATAPSADRERAVARNYNLLGSALANIGDWDGVLQARKRALDLYKGIVARDPKNRSDRRGLALAERGLAGILLRNGDFAGATRHYRESLRIEMALVAENPTNPQLRASLALAHVSLGRALHGSSDYKGALASYHNALRIQEEIAASDPSDVRSSYFLCTTLQRMSATLVKVGAPKQALPYAQRSLDLERKLAGADPANAGARGELATALATMGEVRAAMGDRAEARRWYGEAVAVFMDLEKHGQASMNLRDEARKASAAMARLADSQR
jgi:tetratricopeptide (TPR) repeat protein